MLHVSVFVVSCDQVIKLYLVFPTSVDLKHSLAFIADELPPQMASQPSQQYACSSQPLHVLVFWPPLIVSVQSAPKKILV